MMSMCDAMGSGGSDGEGTRYCPGVLMLGGRRTHKWLARFELPAGYEHEHRAQGH